MKSRVDSTALVVAVATGHASTTVSARRASRGSWRHLNGERGRGRPALEETLPRGWAVDGTGRPTTDPEAALTGALTTGHLALPADVLVAPRRRAGPATTASRQERTS